MANRVLSDKVVIETIALKKYFKVNKSMLHAVDGIDLKIYEGSTLGVVGESGCGKSTLGQTIIRLYDPTSGKILFEGQDIAQMSNSAFRKFQSNMQMIFQDPYSSLNSRMTVSDLIAEPLKVNKYGSSKEIYAKVSEMMDIVGLAQRLANAYPHELDGGRRQRIGVARAIALQPKFVVCDEPVSALDVSIQAQILNLLMDLQDEMNLTYMFITHDLSVVKHISDEIMVMYLGVCVEKAKTNDLFANPLHPYTKALLSAVPLPESSMRGRRPQLIKGELTSPIDPKPGCRFAVRCEHAKEDCMNKTPCLKEVAPGHYVACPYVEGYCGEE